MLDGGQGKTQHYFREQPMPEPNARVRPNHDGCDNTQRGPNASPRTLAITAPLREPNASPCTLAIIAPPREPNASPRTMAITAPLTPPPNVSGPKPHNPDTVQVAIPEVPLNTYPDDVGRNGWGQGSRLTPLLRNKNTTRRVHWTDVQPDGLAPPTLNSGERATGKSTPRLRIENKQKRIQRQLQQTLKPTVWSKHTGTTSPEFDDTPRPTHRNNMCPAGLALKHPAAPLLLDYATNGCPVQTGKPWTREQMEAAIRRGPHISALIPEAMKQLDAEVAEKVRTNQARLIRWKDIQSDPPPELKISPVAMIPHKSRPYRAILDLSFSVKLTPTESIPSVNSTTTKTAPKGSIDQLGHSLNRIIYAFATAPDDARIFMAKWDIKDGFWRLDCASGEEFNFAYVLPSSHTHDPVLVIPTSLQMGWIESPTYFCAASETARDVAATYSNMPLGDIPTHKFLPFTQSQPEYQNLPLDSYSDQFMYMIEVFVDDFIELAIPIRQGHLDHCANSTMRAVHDIFPPNYVPSEDPISERKLIKGDAAWATTKDILGMTFDGTEKTIWLSTEKRDAILHTLKTWIRDTKLRKGIPFAEFQSTLSKIQHAFITIPAGRGLLSPFYKVLTAIPTTVFLHRNSTLLKAVMDCRTFLRETVSDPTKCKSLVTGWPDIVGITDASGHGLGGVVFGENSAVVPTVFRLQWPDDITRAIVSANNPTGTITNSDLEMAGLLMLWLVMETVGAPLEHKHVALFSDNSPTVHWVQRLAAKHSAIAIQLLRALALRLQLQRASPLTPLHIAGVDNSMTDIASRSFGSEKKWHCKTDTDLVHLYNSSFPLPNQASWTVFHLSSDIATRLISILRMKPFTMDDWRRLPTIGKNTGPVGSPTSHLWDWTLIYRKPHTNTEPESSPDSPRESDQAITDDDNKYALVQSLQRSQPLERRFPWPKA